MTTWFQNASEILESLRVSEVVLGALDEESVVIGEVVVDLLEGMEELLAAPHQARAGADQIEKLLGLSGYILPPGHFLRQLLILGRADVLAVLVAPPEGGYRVQVEVELLGEAAVHGVSPVRLVLVGLLPAPDDLLLETLAFGLIGLVELDLEEVLAEEGGFVPGALEGLRVEGAEVGRLEELLVALQLLQSRDVRVQLRLPQHLRLHILRP
eukprot:CAMPEP_0170556398 /NCGR_PEP_ID=MMETSP0211-20121228/16657_1 /TAXON_ID=311385 /ORGANISM="Pseudokeronopsis sp., Strain OXSARD2" /LENGTH=211 /DNA_ID=CAMNT_0010866713 /DNA_START=56 /DNA_END=689 /DNA_ORIENTATION=+